MRGEQAADETKLTSVKSPGPRMKKSPASTHNLQLSHNQYSAMAPNKKNLNVHEYRGTSRNTQIKESYSSSQRSLLNQLNQAPEQSRNRHDPYQGGQVNRSSHSIMESKQSSILHASPR